MFLLKEKKALHFSEDSLSYLHRIAVVPKSQTKRRNPPGNPDPEAMVVALSPRTLLATNRYVCEVCHKGFQRDQNLQLHRRGHNLPWKLKQKSNHQAKKRVFVCPEVSCPHHHPARALGDLTGIKKHYSRKHGEKKWKCDKCCKHYAVQSDLKAHSKICGTKEYRCDCGTVFSRRDSYVTHRAFCDSMTEESNGTVHGMATMVGDSSAMSSYSMPSLKSEPTTNHRLMGSDSIVHLGNGFSRNSNMELCGGSNRQSMTMVGSFMSATALLQKAAQMEPKGLEEGK
ncbi:hypothetical protein HPP92_009552 [Vanilla planifolia]|uniref:Protein EARLY HEADING DATE 2 n=1 Tax=Vanilla planifolia TaxID=51239 RepID=A0A835RK08_VANPL|nr:hypothetical protein HPP92_009552 [Vanilla planifolia]